jgi:hypothetical protein
MFNQDKQFRRPDGTLYDPSSFNVRQYEEQYGPGSVPERWSMAATTPLQSPGLMPESTGKSPEILLASQSFIFTTALAV